MYTILLIYFLNETVINLEEEQLPLFFDYNDTHFPFAPRYFGKVCFQQYKNRPSNCSIDH